MDCPSKPRPLLRRIRGFLVLRWFKIHPIIGRPGHISKEKNVQIQLERIQAQEFVATKQSIMRFVRHRFGPFPARFASTMALNDRLLQHGYVLTVVPACLSVGFLVHTFCHRLRLLIWLAYNGRARARFSVPEVRQRAIIYVLLVAASLHQNIISLVLTLTVCGLSFFVS